MGQNDRCGAHLHPHCRYKLARESLQARESLRLSARVATALTRESRVTARRIRRWDAGSAGRRAAPGARERRARPPAAPHPAPRPAAGGPAAGAGRPVRSRGAAPRSTRFWATCSRSTCGRRAASTAAVAASTSAGSTGSALSGPTSRFAASTASSRAKLRPLPPTGEMTWAASPTSSRPGSLQRSTLVIRTGSRESWLTSVNPSSRSPSHGRRRRRRDDLPDSRCAERRERTGRDRVAELPARRLAEHGEGRARLGEELQTGQRGVVGPARHLDPADVEVGAQLGCGDRRQQSDLGIASVGADHEVGRQPVALSVAAVLQAGDTAGVVARQRRHPGAHLEPERRVAGGLLDHEREEPALRHQRVVGVLRARTAVVGQAVGACRSAPDEGVRPAVRHGREQRVRQPEQVEEVQDGRGEGVAAKPPVEVAPGLQQRHGHPGSGEEVGQYDATGSTAGDHAAGGRDHGRHSRSARGAEPVVSPRW